jgi:hypothetical protein
MSHLASFVTYRFEWTRAVIIMMLLLYLLLVYLTTLIIHKITWRRMWRYMEEILSGLI